MPRTCQKVVGVKTSGLGRRGFLQVYSFDTSCVRIGGWGRIRLGDRKTGGNSGDMATIYQMTPGQVIERVIVAKRCDMTNTLNGKI